MVKNRWWIERMVDLQLSNITYNQRPGNAACIEIAAEIGLKQKYKENKKQEKVINLIWKGYTHREVGKKLRMPYGEVGHVLHGDKKIRQGAKTKWKRFRPKLHYDKDSALLTSIERDQFPREYYNSLLEGRD